MLYYWRINSKGFYNLLIGSLILFLAILAFNKFDKSTVKLLFGRTVPVFSIILLLYFINFTISYQRFKKLRKIFELRPFRELPASVYKIIETKPALIFFLSSLSIRGHSKGYPVRIEYEKGFVIIVIGIDSKTWNSIKVEWSNLSINELGAIKKVKLETLLRNNEEVNLVNMIEEATALLRANNVVPYQLRTT
jgi:hypothetical protein